MRIKTISDRLSHVADAAVLCVPRQSRHLPDDTDDQELRRQSEHQYQNEQTSSILPCGLLTKDFITSDLVLAVRIVIRREGRD